MSILKLKTVMAGLLSLATLSWLSADAVIDKDFDDDQNDFEFYWYYYDDNAGVGPQDRPQRAPMLDPSVIDVPYTERERHGYDGNDTADKWMVKEYKFQTTEALSKRCATMPFTFGDPWVAKYCQGENDTCAEPYVGIGTIDRKSVV